MNISGTVINFDTKQPIPNAIISQGNVNPGNYVRTDVNGRFILPRVDDATKPIAIYIEGSNWEQADGTNTRFREIPQPAPPANWIIEIAPASSLINAQDGNLQTVQILKDRNRWLIYGGIGLLALILYSKYKKKKGRKR